MTDKWDCNNRNRRNEVAEKDRSSVSERTRSSSANVALRAPSGRPNGKQYLQSTDIRVDSAHETSCRNSLTAFSSAYSKRVPHTNCAPRIKKCAPRISSGIYFFKHKLINK